MMRMQGVKLNKAEVEKILKSDISKSEKMKKLFLGGLEVKEISLLLNVSYNFVYNVTSNMIRVNDLEDKVIKENRENKKDKIKELYKKGKSNVEISRILKCNYNYVWKTVNTLIKEGVKVEAK